jgi:antitoxin component YwqK of YwqJK toxin-antitoxin module
MRQIVAFFVLFFIAVSVSFGQNETDSQGRKQGKWVKYHNDGKTIRYKGQFKDDVPYGKFIYYYASGEVQTILEYEEDGSALAKTYFTHGSLMAKGYFLNQKKDGTWWYFSADKLLISKEVYKNGQLNGVSYKYFPTEIGEQPNVLEAVNYVDGLAEGEWKRYFKDGKIQMKGNYLNGLQQGECIWYTTTGKADVVGYFKDGKKHGQWRYYDEEGEYTTKFFLLDNEIKGEVLEQYLESQKKAQGN